MQRNWHLLDAKEFVLGRLASQAAQYLMGKHKTGFVRHSDTGDYVVIVNAEKIKVTGNKEAQKLYTNYTGFPGGLKVKNLHEVRQKKPSYLIEHAVWGMLPKNKLRTNMRNRLKIFSGSDHPYESQFNNKSEKKETKKLI